MPAPDLTQFSDIVVGYHHLGPCLGFFEAEVRGDRASVNRQDAG